MPKIPLPQNRTVSHVAAETPLTGGGLQLRYYGDGIDANAVSSGLKSIGSAMVKFTEEFNETENRLAAAEDRAFFNQSAEELRLKLADNPGASDEDKERWIAEFQQNYLHDRVQFTDRMTAKFRKGHDIEMLALQQSAANKQSLILIQSKVQRQLDEADTLYKTACDRADFAGARRIIEENTGTLFNAETAARLLEYDLPMREQYYQVSRLAEADPDKAVAMLEDQKNFDKLSTANRDRLIRFAKENGARQLSDEYQKVCADLVSTGNFPYTPEQMKELYDSGEWSAKKYNMFDNLYKGYLKQTEQKNLEQEIAGISSSGVFPYTPEEMQELYDTGEWNAKEYNKYTALYDKFTAAKRSASEKRQRLLFDDIKGKIELLEYPHPNQMQQIKLDIFEQIQKAFPDDPSRQAQLMKVLTDKLKHDPLEDSENGKMLKAQIIDTCNSLENEGKVPYDNVINLRTDLLAAARQLINDPKLTFSEASKKLDEAKTAYCNKAIGSILNPATGELRDMSKYGKVFDSRRENETAMIPVPGSPMSLVPLFVNAKRKKRIKEGYIDKADVVESGIVKDEKGRERTFWKMKDGRTLYADEYEK